MKTQLWNNRFSDQVAVITGGADGLGFAIAGRLIGEGATVWLLDRDEARLKAAANKLGSKAHALAADIVNEAQIQSGFEGIYAGENRIDIVVNCAGIVGPNNRKITETPTDGYEQVLRVNLFGSFLVCKHALVQMQKRNYGRVLLIASIAGKEGNAGMCGYSSAKAGVIGLVKSAGKEFAETGITINALAPAVVRTALVEGMEPAQVKYMTDKIPMKRCGTLEEVASLATWIVSPEASFNTGFTFDLTGGRAVY
ncbi:MAG: SDR family NAD(P)-dependent oxidoreductase [Opitutaceae bacterium]|nr:SDR family NAD(P)-dependent oxidoreductase [Opitutaceae bacterium]